MSTQRLKKIETEIEAIKARVAEIGVVRPGSLTQQYKAPESHSGGYYQVSYTHRMKSKTSYVRKDCVKEVRGQIRDYKKLKGLIEKWVALGIEYSQLSMKRNSR